MPIINPEPMATQIEQMARLIEGVWFDFDKLPNGEHKQLHDLANVHQADWLRGASAFEEGLFSVNTDTSYQLTPAVHEVRALAFLFKKNARWDSNDRSRSWERGSLVGNATGKNVSGYDSGGLGLNRWSNSVPFWGYWRSDDYFSSPSNIWVDGLSVSNSAAFDLTNRLSTNKVSLVLMNLQGSMTVNRRFSSGLGWSIKPIVYGGLGLLPTALTDERVAELQDLQV